MKFCEALQLIHRHEAAEQTSSWLEFCEAEGIYHLCTEEFLDALAEAVQSLRPERIVEICAGAGTIGAGLRERGLHLISTDAGTSDDLIAGSDVIKLTVSQALQTYDPNCVIGCWVPVDDNLDLQVLRHPTVRSYIYIGQYMNGMIGPEMIWREPGWSSLPLPELDRYSICRADYLTLETPPRLVQHGRSFLFTRT